MEDYNKAEARSKALFESHLTPEQFAQYVDNKPIQVRGNVSGRDYIMTLGHIAGNTFRLAQDNSPFSALVMDNAFIDRRYCFYIRDDYNVPRWDHFLAQKLMIERCEDDFLRIACAG